MLADEIHFNQGTIRVWDLESDEDKVKVKSDEGSNEDGIIYL